MCLASTNHLFLCCYVTDGDWKLVVVTQASYVGMVPHGGEVFCVDKVGIIPLTSNSGIAAEITGLEARR